LRNVNTNMCAEMSSSIMRDSCGSRRTRRASFWLSTRQTRHGLLLFSFVTR
jgi:hypothetical protein